MKGVVFREFVAFADRRFGEEAVESLIDECALESGGAYASTGRYPAEELTRLVDAACAHAGCGRDALIEEFGAAICGAFRRSHARHFDAADDLFDFLERVDACIHPEVIKLYPDAELPQFRTAARDDTSLVLDYTSPRRLHHLAKGLIEEAARHYGEPVDVALKVFPADAAITARLTVTRVTP